MQLVRGVREGQEDHVKTHPFFSRAMLVNLGLMKSVIVDKRVQLLVARLRLEVYELLFKFYLMKSLIWNARGLGNNPILRRLKFIIKTHRLLMVAVVEPFINVDRGVGIRDQLGFDEFVANDEDTAKIWIFSKNIA